MRIAIDVMGGDYGPDVIIPSALRCIADHSDLQLILVGNQGQLQQILSKFNHDENRVQVLHADEFIGMDEKPAAALRHKKQSSMHLAIELINQGKADACVSSGNTGALMAIARHLLKTHPGIDRPAIIKAIPSIQGRCYLLDLGANINCNANNLTQFAAMGSLMCEALEKISNPRVGLLNIGHEDIKGGTEVRHAAELLAENKSLNFVGYIEGDGIYSGDTDVVVCDGWGGNIALKTSEGLARYMSKIIRDEFDSNLLSQAAGIIATPVLKKIKMRLSPEQYNGATLLGLNGIVVKSHGRAGKEGFYHALLETMRMVGNKVPTIFRGRLDDVLSGFNQP